MYWKHLGLRMVGKAELSTFSEPRDNRPGYDLTIKGLEFRYGGDGVPEADLQRYVSILPDIKRITVVDLGDKKLRYALSLTRHTSNYLPRSNGVGRLHILYNDGNLRISKDFDQRLAYVHLREPLDPSLKLDF